MLGSSALFQIKLTSVMVSDQKKALTFYTDILGFIKNMDIPMGEFRWLTAFNVEDAEAEFERLKLRGVVFQTEPTKMGEATVAVFEDTCGNLIQIYQV